MQPEDSGKTEGKNPAAVALGKLGGQKGGPARAEKLSRERRSEIARIAANTRWSTIRKKGSAVEKQWTKILTKSEAVQPEAGSGEMPFIRCTKADHPIDHATYFREDFFLNAPWRPGYDGREAASVAVEVTIDGKKLGRQNLVIDHDPARTKNHSAPTTHIHYNDAVLAELKQSDMTGASLTICTDGEEISLVISKK